MQTAIKAILFVIATALFAVVLPLVFVVACFQGVNPLSRSRQWWADCFGGLELLLDW